MNKRTLLLAIAIALISAGAGVSLQLFLAEEGQPGRPLNDARQSLASLLGKQAAPFVLERLNGGSAGLEDWAGQVRIVNFWATWCEPCRREMPELKRLHADFEAKGVVVIGIAIDDQEPVRQFVDKLEINYPVLVVPGTESFALMESYGNARGLMPQTVIVDRDGVIRSAVLGEVSYEQLQKAVEAL